MVCVVNEVPLRGLQCWTEGQERRKVFFTISVFRIPHFDYLPSTLELQMRVYKICIWNSSKKKGEKKWETVDKERVTHILPSGLSLVKIFKLPSCLKNKQTIKASFHILASNILVYKHAFIACSVAESTIIYSASYTSNQIAGCILMLKLLLSVLFGNQFQPWLTILYTLFL